MSRKSFETLTESEVLEIIPMTFIAIENATKTGNTWAKSTLEKGLEKLIDRLIELLLTTDGKGN